MEAVVICSDADMLGNKETRAHRGWQKVRGTGGIDERGGYRR
jgi:hypothetical protein